MSEEELREYIKAKREPISHCVDLTKYFIGRHKTLPVYLTRAFEQEFNYSMYELEKLREQNKKYKEVIDKAIKCVYYNTKYRNGADIYQFVDIESEILEPLQDILEQNDNSNNAYLKEFNDWLKEVK